MAGFKDPLDEEADAAEGRSVAKGADALRDRMRAAREVDTEEVVVEDPPDDDEEEEVAEAKEAALTRREKRGARVTARERAAAAEAEARVLREQLALRQAEKPAQSQPQQNAALADVDRRLREGFKRQTALFDEYEAKKERLSPREHQEYYDKGVELEVELGMLKTERYEVLSEPKRRQQAVLEQARSEWPDVYGNQQAIDYAAGRLRQLMALGHQDSKQLHDQVMLETREAILGKRPKPDALQRQRATGISSAVAPAGAPAPVKLSMPKGSPLYRMATAMYPDLEPAAACQKWANKNGKRFAEISKGHR